MSKFIKLQKALETRIMNEDVINKIANFYSGFKEDRVTPAEMEELIHFIPFVLTNTNYHRVDERWTLDKIVEDIARRFYEKKFPKQLAEFDQQAYNMRILNTGDNYNTGGIDYSTGLPTDGGGSSAPVSLIPVYDGLRNYELMLNTRYRDLGAGDISFDIKTTAFNTTGAAGVQTDILNVREIEIGEFFVNYSAGFDNVYDLLYIGISEINSQAIQGPLGARFHFVMQSSRERNRIRMKPFGIRGKFKFITLVDSMPKITFLFRTPELNITPYPDRATPTVYYENPMRFVGTTEHHMNTGDLVYITGFSGTSKDADVNRSAGHYITKISNTEFTIPVDLALFLFRITPAMSPYTITSPDLYRYWYCNTTSGSTTINLPQASAVPGYTIRKPIATNSVTLVRFVGDTINFIAASYIINAISEVTFQSDGITNWNLISISGSVVSDVFPIVVFQNMTFLIPMTIRTQQ